MHAVRRAAMIAICGSLMLPAVASAKKGAILGQVTDRNGDAMVGATVELVDRFATVLTDSEGRFRIDYMRQADGKQVKLAKTTTYVLLVTLPGFHDVTGQIEYKRGEFEVQPVTMIPETVEVQDIRVPLWTDISSPSGRTEGVVRQWD